MFSVYLTNSIKCHKITCDYLRLICRSHSDGSHYQQSSSSVRVMTEESKIHNPMHVSPSLPVCAPESEAVSQSETIQVPQLNLQVMTSQPDTQENITQEQDHLLSQATERVQQSVHFGDIQSTRMRGPGQFQLLTPDHFLSHPDYMTVTSQNDISPLSTPRTIDSTVLAVRSMIQTIDSTADIPEVPHRVNDGQNLPLSEQIIRIRNQLKGFEQQKRKLR